MRLASDMLELLKNRLEKCILNPLAGGATATLTILAGAFASFFADEIKSHSYPWPVTSIKYLSWWSTSFWLSVFGVGFLLGASQWGQARAAARARSQVDQQATNLEALIHRIESLPAESFLGSFQTATRRAMLSTLMASLDQDSTKEEVEHAIRNVLGAILSLAKEYDKSIKTAVYAANIMIFQQCHELEGSNRHKVIELPDNHPDYRGRLVLLPCLSTSTDQRDFGIDPNQVDFELPIPLKTGLSIDGGNIPRDPVLPGAPWAFVRKEYASFASIPALHEWLNIKSGASISHQQAIRQYFTDGNGKHIRSFASMPLIGVDPQAEDHQPIGVLNIHSDHEGLLESMGEERFVPLIEPFRMLLSVLLVLRSGKQLATSKTDQPCGKDVAGDSNHE
jgi:hypothetical protein